jgi:hypothetical protein
VRQAESAEEAQAAVVAASRRQVEAARGALTAAKANLANPASRTAQAAAVRGQIRADIAAATADAERARAQLDEARANRSDLQVIAPFSGTVVTRTAEPGEVVVAGTPIVTLLNLAEVYLRAFVPEGDIGRVKVGQPARVYLDSAPKKPGRPRRVPAGGRMGGDVVADPTDLRHRPRVLCARVARDPAHAGERMNGRRDHGQSALLRLSISSGGGPAPGELDHGRLVLRPVVQGGGIEIGAVRPHEGVHFAVERDGVELVKIAQRLVELPFQHRPEVYRADQAVVEFDPESIGPFDLERLHFVDGMSHLCHSLSKRLDLSGRSTCLESIPSGQELGLMDFAPRFHEPALLLMKTAANELDGIDREDADVILIVRMEMRSMVGCRWFGEHTDDDPEESSDLWHPGSESPETVALNLATPSELSHSENSTRSDRSASACLSPLCCGPLPGVLITLTLQSFCNHRLQLPVTPGRDTELTGQSCRPGKRGRDHRPRALRHGPNLRSQGFSCQCAGTDTARTRRMQVNA